MSLTSLLKNLEAYEDCEFDEHLLARLSQSIPALTQATPLQFHLPSLKHFESEELACCSSGNLWPSISITGPECKLQCDHCKASILEPMIPATTPQQLWDEINRLIDGGAQGLLLSGGSNHRNEVEYGPYLPVIRRIKDRYPEFRMAVHTALVNEDGARSLEQAGIDVAMFDVIGAQDTIRHVYHLRREVEDFEATMAALAATTMKLVPHIVLGLHYGNLLGEWKALEIVGRHRLDALVLVVVMPHYADPRHPFKTPNATEVGGFFLDARKALPDTPLLLGCARPPGRTKTLIDAYAVMAGLDGIAYPSEGAVSLNRQLGRSHEVAHSCCSISILDSLARQLGSPSATLVHPGRAQEHSIAWIG